MAKGKDKKSAKGKQSTEKVDKGKTPPEAEIVEEPEPPPDIRTITITIEGFKNIVPIFSATDIMVTGKYLEQNLGETPKILVTDEEIITTCHEYKIECNLNSAIDVDKLISNPVVFTVIESPGEMDMAVYEQLQQNAVPPVSHSILSAESAADLLEALTNEKAERDIVDKKSKTSSKKESPKGSRKGSKKGSTDKTKKDSGASKKSKGKAEKEKKIDKSAEAEIPKKPITLGICSLDLIPLFMGLQMIEESLPIVSAQQFYDDRMITIKTMPRLIVTAKVDKIWTFNQRKSPNILNFTVESMYNLPSIMSPEMQYKVCASLPNMKAKFEPVVLSNAKHTQEKNLDPYKRWPEMKTHDVTSATKYKVDLTTHDIRNNADVDLDAILESETPRIEWNIIKRTFLLEDALTNFFYKVKKYRHIAIEIFMTPDTDKEEEQNQDAGKGKDKGGKKGKSDKSSKSSKDKGKKGAKKASSQGDGLFCEYLHLMALVDVSSLLYPGVNKVRVACPLTTYHEIEVLETAGLDNSYFMPKKVETPDVGAKRKGKDKKGNAKSPKSSKGSKGSKKGGPGDSKEPKNLKEQLPPPPPPPPEPSIKVYSENGDPTFIIIEFEMLHPFSPKRELEDLSMELEQMIKKRPELPKIIMSSRLATQYYQEIIKQLITDMNQQYQTYTEEIKKCTCYSPDHGHHADFLAYLRRNGIYQTYLNSLTKAASVIVNDKFSYEGQYNKGSSEYQNFIAEVFAHLVSEMNVVFNQIATSALEPPPLGSLAGLDPLLLYAKEACELSADSLANRYYLERITRDEQNSDYWFDYAIFLLEMGDFEKAFECVHEALTINIEHKYSLLLYGILLSEKGQQAEAETCFLTVMLQQPRWVEGWGVLFLFYQQENNREGAELSQEMAQKYLNDPRQEMDYFKATDDLAWSTSIVPNTIFFRTAVLLIKMRVFNFAEKALACEIYKKSGIIQYLLGVIDYYKNQLDSAFVHIKEAESLHGPDYAVTGTSGHILLAMGILDEAKIQYLRVIESFDRPEDIHMIYINLAVIYDLTENTQEARKILLLVCKFSPTPYSWLAAGLMYYKQRDLLSAEECLTEANLCDNRLPEIWGYLTMVNLQLDRFSEAELCYRQTVKNNLTNTELLEKIEKATEVLGKYIPKSKTINKE